MTAFKISTMPFLSDYVQLTIDRPKWYCITPTLVLRIRMYIWVDL